MIFKTNNESHYAMKGDVKSGPKFGLGLDIYIRDNCNTSPITNGTSMKDTNVSYKYSRTKDSIPISVCGGEAVCAGGSYANVFQVVDYDVFQVS